MDIWKAFDQNKITHSAAHHLMTIYELLEQNGYARVTDVAKMLEITRGSASITLKALREKGLVIEDENKFLRLSPKGERISQSIHAIKTIFKKFLINVLEVESAQAEIDACKIEHLLSPQTGERLLHFMKFLSSDDAIVRDFLREYHAYESSCTGSAETCEVCETECLMPEETETDQE